MVGYKELFSLTLVNDFLTSRNGLLIPTGNLGIPRSQMPQIKDYKKFVKILDGYGIKVKKVRRRIGDLKLVQNEVNKDKVFKLMLEYRKLNRRTRGGVNISGFPPVISNDDLVLDGLHRQVAMYNMNKHAYHEYTMVDHPLKELYALIKDNPTVFGSSVEYKSLSESLN